MKHILFMDLAGMRVRYRFYFIWMLADSINNLAGLGFNGRDELGYAKWDLVTVIYPTVVETSVNLRMLINNFNICTMLWLRRYVHIYECNYTRLQTRAHTHTHTHTRIGLCMKE